MELERVAERFAAIASGVEAHQQNAALMRLFSEAAAACQRAVGEASGDTRRLLTNVATALDTWRQVWPRLGAQTEFRAAVAREAGFWAKRFARRESDG